MEIIPVDHTPLLDTVFEIQVVANDLMEKLKAKVETEDQRNTVAAICMVVETQSEMIRQLVDMQIALVDRTEEIMRDSQA